MKPLSLLIFLTMVISAAASDAEYLSPSDLAIAPDGKSALVVNRTGKSVFRVSLPDGRILKQAPLKQEPSSIALSPDGTHAYIAAGIEDGRLIIIDAQSLDAIDSMQLGHTPTSPCPAPDGKTLYVCDRMNHRVCAIDVASMKMISSVSVPREPIAITITPDGQTLYIANHLSSKRANSGHVSCAISVVDARSMKLLKNIPLVNGAISLRDIVISPDGKYVYTAHLVARYLVPTTQVERGWINTSGLSIIRTADQALVCTVLLDDVDMGFANPWGLDINDDASVMVVSAAGTRELSLINLPALSAKIEELSAVPGQLGRTHNDLSFLAGLRTRVKLKGIGPREVAIHGNSAYAVEYFTDSLAHVVFDGTRPVQVASIPLAPEQPMTRVRRGEMLFNDATMCFQQWQSCASCHPDTRADGLNWDLLNDGIGNPKNVKSMILSHATPPVMALGVRDKAEVAVRAGIRYIQFTVRPDEDAQAIDTYLTGLTPQPSPYLVNGKLSSRAERGKILFKDAGCIACHPAPYYTNLKQFDVGTGTGQDKGKPFDVPTLCEVWRTAPYMHDGRAQSIYEVIKTHNPEDKRGRTSSLTDEQTKDLAEYVNSL